MTPSDLQSPIWRRFTKELQLRLQELREANDAVCTPDKTALIRGQISEVKRLISLSSGSEIANDFLREDEVELPQGDY